MAAYFVPPLPFAIGSETTNAGFAAINMNSDIPSLVWRGASSAPISFVLDFGTGSVNYDAIILIGTNLRADDTVQLRTGTNAAGTNGLAMGGAGPAWTGTKPATYSSKYIRVLPSPRTDRYMRVDLTAPTSHPDGYFSIQRIVVGKLISTQGVSYGYEHGMTDRSVITAGPGYSSVDEYDVVPTLKFTTKWISDASVYGDFMPMFHQYASRRGVFFNANDQSANPQVDSIFGRFSTPPVMVSNFYNSWTFEAKIEALAP